MGKGKKRKAPPGDRREQRREEAPNMFERLSNKKRFDIMGRKLKGETRQLGKLRTAATERRKDTLLVEYKQLRKSNAFIDRRFGEDDESLTADEKALLRFQKQRLKEMAGSKFSLPEDEGEGGGGGGEQLTHMGRSLAELEDLGGGWGSDDDDANLDEQMTRDFHFGGGLFERKEGGGGGEGGEERPQRKSKKEVMEELIAKSKAYKAEKQRQREEDQDETAALDDQFRALMDGKALLGLLRKKGEKRDNRSDGQADQAYDVLTRELVFEAKAQPGDRTMTAEQLGELERQRLEALEAQRRRRQEGEEGGSEDEDEEGGGGGAQTTAAAAGLPAGGYARRRAKRARLGEDQGRSLGGGASGDALEDDWAIGSDEDSESGSEDEGSSGSEGEEGGGGHGGRQLTKLELRRQARAAGSHPLQDSFRQAAAQLLKKHRREAGEDVSSDEEDDEEEGSSGSEEEGEEDELEGGSGSEEEEGGEEVQEEEEGAAAALASEEEEKPGSSLEGDSSGSEEEEEEEESEDEEEGGRPGKQQQKQQPQAKAAAAEHPQQRPRAAAAPAAAAAAARLPLAEGVSADLPYTPPLPDSYEAFAKLAGGRSAADLGELVHRIRVVHAASLNAEHRQGLQLLYGILVQHFASLAGSASLAGDDVAGDGGRRLPLAHLDALVPHLVELTPQVPFYSATLARARLQRAQELLAECLGDPVTRADAWPAPRVLLLLKLFATVFPASDKRHPVLTPASLLACSCLSNCPLARPQQVATGLYLASLALHLHSQAQRFVPEPLAFAVELLQGVLPAGTAPPLPPSHQRQLEAGQTHWLAVGAGDVDADALPATPEEIAPLELERVLALAANGSSGVGGAYWRSAGFKTSAAAAAVKLVLRSAELLGGNAALPEVLQPALDALHAIVAAAEAAQVAAAAAPPTRKKQKRGKQQQAAAAAATATPTAILAPGLVTLCASAAEQLGAAAEAARAGRRPMVNVALLKVAEKRQYNPRFEEDFVSGKDYDPDRERSDRRKLQRSIKREERGAARELRRDAAFMSDVRDREKAAKQAELFASEQRAKSFLHQQAADAASGGQGGMWKKGGKKRK